MNEHITSQHTKLFEVVQQHLGVRLQNSELNNLDMVKLIETIGQYLNLKTISDYSKHSGITYNGVIERIKSGKLKTIELFNVKFVIDNF